MNKYHYKNNAFKQKNHVATSRRIVFVIILLIILVALGIGIERLYTRKTENKVITSEAKSSIQASAINVFKSKYFQFQADTSWVEVAGESNENKYAYRSMRGPLVEHDLFIYVNAAPPDTAVSRVQPANVKDKKELVVNAPLSEHCRSSVPKGVPLNVTRLSLGGVTFNCRPDSALFTVLVAEPNDSQVIKMQRPDGSSIQFTIIYRDLTANPTGSKLKPIAESFQVR